MADVSGDYRSLASLQTDHLVHGRFTDHSSMSWQAYALLRLQVAEEYVGFCHCGHLPYGVYDREIVVAKRRIVIVYNRCGHSLVSYVALKKLYSIIPKP